jgi:2-octaprenyl-6-methoxyphenol hydroxylase
MNKHKIWDYAILGKGLLGSLSAIALCKKFPKLDICIVDKNPRAHIVQDTRATALSQSSVDFLTDAGLWSALYSQMAKILEIHIGMSVDRLQLTFDDPPNPVGYNIPNDALRAAFLVDTIPSFDGQAVTDIKNTAHTIQLTLEDGTLIETRLLIATDGRYSAARKLLTQTKEHNFNQTAFTCSVRHSLPHNNKAYELFLPQGALAFIPLQDPNESTLVWSIKDQFISSSLDQADLMKSLHPVAGSLLGTFQCLTSLAKHPIISTSAKQSAGHRWVLLGDASTALHPVAGQGLNLGIRDLSALVNHLDKTISLGLDIGSYTGLSQYMRNRTLDKKGLLWSTYFSASPLTSSNHLLGHLWSKGMKSLNSRRTLVNTLRNFAQFGRLIK